MRVHNYAVCFNTLINRSIQEEEEDEEEALEFVAEDEIEESDLSDIEVHTLSVQPRPQAVASEVK